MTVPIAPKTAHPGETESSSSRAVLFGVMSGPPTPTCPAIPPVTAPTAAKVLTLVRAHHQSWADSFHLRRIGLFGSVGRG